MCVPKPNFNVDDFVYLIGVAENNEMLVHKSYTFTFFVISIHFGNDANVWARSNRMISLFREMSIISVLTKIGRKFLDLD